MSKTLTNDARQAATAFWGSGSTSQTVPPSRGGIDSGYHATYSVSESCADSLHVVARGDSGQPTITQTGRDYFAALRIQDRVKAAWGEVFAKHSTARGCGAGEGGNNEEKARLNITYSRLTLEQFEYARPGEVVELVEVTVENRSSFVLWVRSDVVRNFWVISVCVGGEPSLWLQPASEVQVDGLFVGVTEKHVVDCPMENILAWGMFLAERNAKRIGGAL